MCYTVSGDGIHNKKQITTEYVTKGEIPIEKNVVVQKDLSYSEWWESRHGYQGHKQSSAKSIDLTGACLSLSTLEKLLEKMDGHGEVNLTGACISEE